MNTNHLSETAVDALRQIAINAGYASSNVAEVWLDRFYQQQKRLYSENDRDKMYGEQEEVAFVLEDFFTRLMKTNNFESVEGNIDDIITTMLSAAADLEFMHFDGVTFISDSYEDWEENANNLNYCQVGFLVEDRLYALKELKKLQEDADLTHQLEGGTPDFYLCQSLVVPISEGTWFPNLPLADRQQLIQKMDKYIDIVRQ